MIEEKHVTKKIRNTYKEKGLGKGRTKKYERKPGKTRKKRSKKRTVRLEVCRCKD